MPRKERKRVKATKITPVVNTGGVKSSEPTIDVEKETIKQNSFHELCMAVSEALRSEQGTKLSCRVKVLVEDSSAVIYQGMLSNVWGRFTADGKSNIYRHALKQVLLEDPRTKHLCD